MEKKNRPTPKQNKWKDPFFANACISRGTKDLRPAHLRRQRRAGFKKFFMDIIIRLMPWIANNQLKKEKQARRVKIQKQNTGKYGYRPSQHTMLRNHTRKSASR